MHVAVLQQFLRSLVPALEAAGDGRAAAQGLEAATRALDPFRTVGVAEFATFLIRAEEYRATGTVRMPGPADLRVEGLAAALVRLAAARDQPLAVDPAAAQAAVAQAIGELAREAGLKGTLATDPSWAAALVARARLAPHLEAIRGLAARITSPEVYADEAVQAEMRRVETALDPAAVKAVGAEFGVKVTAKTNPARFLADVLVKLTGHKPAKAKAARKPKAPAAAVDPAVVEEHSQRLGDLVQRSADPDAVSDAEVEAELARLQDLPKPTLLEVVAKTGIEGAKPRDALSAILGKVRSRLTAARRARERAEV